MAPTPRRRARDKPRLIWGGDVLTRWEPLLDHQHGRGFRMTRTMNSTTQWEFHATSSTPWCPVWEELDTSLNRPSETSGQHGQIRRPWVGEAPLYRKDTGVRKTDQQGSKASKQARQGRQWLNHLWLKTYEPSDAIPAMIRTQRHNLGRKH
jgi:hypothetical protein